MNTIFIEIGVFCVALILAVFFQMAADRKKYRDCLLFSRLLLAAVAIFVVDTVGWVIDGNPVGGQVWFTTVIDGLDLVLTTTVSWCWVQYALFIARGTTGIKRKWYRDFATWLLILQIVLVSCSQIFGFYYSVDAAGVYHRERGYFLHSLISVAMLFYSSIACLRAHHAERDAQRRRDQLFVTLIILIPIAGNVFQLLVYGYPTVWLCMGFMIFTVYVHIQNKRINAEREKQNRELTAALQQAQVASRAKTDFLSRMSHDMRTPMNGILGLASLLREKVETPEMRTDVEQIIQSGHYLLNLINDTLDMSKIEAGRMELHPVPVGSEELFKNVIVTARVLAAEKGVALKLELPPIASGSWVPVMTDPARVEQVFMNLISNAIKFTPRGGTVTLHMDTVAVRADSVTDRYIIADTGIGMSEAFLEHACEPFSQEGHGRDDHSCGTGLGLAIAKQIVDMLGGSMRIESRENAGTKITLEISYPRYNGVIRSTAAETDFTRLRGKRVLLCEDHPVNAQIAMRLLERQGMRVDHAENGQIGLERFCASPEYAYDLIFMDIRMPVMNGLEAAKAIRHVQNRADAGTVPIIAMTANAFEEDVRECLAAGMNAHMAKPIEPESMYRTIAQMLQ